MFGSCAIRFPAPRRLAFEGGDWQRAELSVVAGVNGTLALLTDDPLVFFMDDVAVTVECTRARFPRVPLKVCKGGET